MLDYPVNLAKAKFGGQVGHSPYEDRFRKCRMEDLPSMMVSCPRSGIGL